MRDLSPEGDVVFVPADEASVSRPSPPPGAPGPPCAEGVGESEGAAGATGAAAAAATEATGAASAEEAVEALSCDFVGDLKKSVEKNAPSDVRYEAAAYAKADECYGSKGGGDNGG